jgi:hypothetical protein
MRIPAILLIILLGVIFIAGCTTQPSGTTRVTQSLTSTPTPMASLENKMLGKIGPNDELLLQNTSFVTTREGTSFKYSLKNQGSSEYSNLNLEAKIILVLDDGREVTRYESNTFETIAPQQIISKQIPVIKSGEFGNKPQVVMYKLSGSRDGVTFTSNEDIVIKIGG